MIGQRRKITTITGKRKAKLRKGTDITSAYLFELSNCDSGTAFIFFVTYKWAK